MSNILLIGDISRDVFLHCDVPRLSPEKPCPIAIPHSVYTNPGMAANVLANINTLAPEIKVMTIFPPSLSVKTRYVDAVSNQHLLRVDQDYISKPLEVNDFTNLIGIDIFDACVISCYAKGWLNAKNMQTIATICQNRGVPTFCDTKQILGEWSKSITYVKINQKEFDAQLTAGNKEPWLSCHNLIVTQGKRGMVWLGKAGQEIHRTQTSDSQIVDTVGCGDVALAGLVVGCLETGDLKRAMDFATKASSYAASQKGVVAVKREEVV